MNLQDIAEQSLFARWHLEEWLGDMAGGPVELNLRTLENGNGRQEGIPDNQAAAFRRAANCIDEAHAVAASEVIHGRLEAEARELAFDFAHEDDDENYRRSLDVIDNFDPDDFPDGVFFFDGLRTDLEPDHVRHLYGTDDEPPAVLYMKELNDQLPSVLAVYLNDAGPESAIFQRVPDSLTADDVRLGYWSTASPGITAQVLTIARFMHGRIVNEVRPGRPARRRLARAGIELPEDGTVIVVHLRAVDTTGRELPDVKPDGTGRAAYRYRFLVREHRRRLDYLEKGRTTIVPEYLKGPAGAPIVIKNKLHWVRR